MDGRHFYLYDDNLSKVITVSKKKIEIKRFQKKINPLKKISLQMKRRKLYWIKIKNPKRVVQHGQKFKKLLQKNLENEKKLAKSNY